MPSALRRQLRHTDIRCPAGELAGDANVRCKIEQNTIVGPENPESVEGFCCGAYETCSSWLAAKAIEARGGNLQKVMAQQVSQAAQMRMAMALRQARMRMAQRLMVDPSPEGKAFRRKLRIGEFAPARDVVGESG